MTGSNTEEIYGASTQMGNNNNGLDSSLSGIAGSIK